MVAQEAHALGDVVARGEDHAAVAAAAEVLRGIEREGAGIAPCGHWPAVVVGAHRLGGVGYHGQAPAMRDRLDLVHGRGLTVQVHGHHGPRPRRDGRLETPGIEVVGLRVDVDEDRDGADQHNRARGGDEREGRRDHLVAGAHTHRLEGEQQRVGARVEADAVPGAAEGSELGLEGPDLGAEDEAAAREDASGGGKELFAREPRAAA